MDILEDMLDPEELVIEAELAGAPEGQALVSVLQHVYALPDSVKSVC